MSDPAPPEEQRAQETMRSLEVYAMPGCPGWQRAMTLATLARNATIPGIDVRVCDLSLSETRVPESVVASPTWLLDGRRIALGNPDPAWLLARLGALVTGRR